MSTSDVAMGIPDPTLLSLLETSVTLIYAFFILSPLPAIINAIRTKNLDQVPFKMICVNSLNVLLWGIYSYKVGLVIVAFVNLAGVPIQLFYIFVYLYIKKKQELWIFIIILTVYSYIFYYLWDDSTDINIVNASAGVTAYTVQLSPITFVMECFREKTQRFINCLMLVPSLISSVLMGSIGIMFKDWLWTVTPQAIGLILAFAQIAKSKRHRGNTQIVASLPPLAGIYLEFLLY